MKRNILSRKKHFLSESEIDDVYSNFDVAELELLENKSLAESFESLRQVTSVVSIGLTGVDARLDGLKLKDKEESDRGTLTGCAMEIVEAGSLLENDAVKWEVAARETLSLNTNSSTPLKNRNIITDQELTKVDNDLVVNIPASDDVSIPVDNRKDFNFEELFKENALTVDFEIEEHCSDEEDSFQYECNNDIFENNSNEVDTSLDFLSYVDLEDIIDVSDSSYLGLFDDNSDELVSISLRSKQAANVVSQDFGLSKECFDKLSDVFLHNGWGPCRVAIIKQLNSGRSVKEIWNAHEIREVWRSMQDVWQLGRAIPAKFDQLRVQNKKKLNARKNLLEMEELLNTSDESLNKKSKKVTEIQLVKVNNKKSNTMAWTLALRLVDFFDMQTVDTEYVSEFFCYIHQGWLDLIKSYKNPIRFEIYLHHQLSELSVSWRKPAPLPNEELWWNDPPAYSDDPYQFDCLMGRCYEENSSDYMDIKEQFNEL